MICFYLLPLQEHGPGAHMRLVKECTDKITNVMMRMGADGARDTASHEREMVATTAL